MKREDQWVFQLNDLISSYSPRFFRPPVLESFPCLPDIYGCFGIRSEPKDSQAFASLKPSEKDNFLSCFVILAIHAFFAWLNPWVPLGWKLHEGRKCLFYSLLYSQHLELYLVHSRCSVNIRGMKGRYYLIKDRIIANSFCKVVATLEIKPFWQKKSVIGIIMITPISFLFCFNFEWISLYIFIRIQLYFFLNDRPLRCYLLISLTETAVHRKGKSPWGTMSDVTGTWNLFQSDL